MKTPACHALVILLVLGLCCAPRAAEARVKRAMRAPSLDVLETVGGAPFTLRAERGRMVLLQFFSVHCKHCRAAVPRMNEILAKFGARGLTVVGVTRESRGEVVTFRAGHAVRYPVAIAHVDVQREYGFEAYPMAFLIAPNGRVLWRGDLKRMRDRVLDAYFARVRLLPAPPPAYAWTRAAVAQHALERIHAELDRHRRCSPVDRGDCAFILGTLAWLDWYAKTCMAGAAADEAAGRGYSAWRTYDELAHAFGPMEAGRRAAARRDGLLSDPDRACEIRARAALVEARSRARAGTASMAVRLLRAVAGAHPGTQAAAEARALAGGWTATAVPE